MSEVIELAESTLHILLMALGVFILILISKVYGLYKAMKINRSVMTPMLLAGLFVALSGITELIELYVGEIGHVLHIIVMFVMTVSFTYGIYGYYQMLNKTREPR